MSALIQSGSDDLAAFVEELESVRGGNRFPARIDANSENVEKGLAKLVLTVG